MLMLGVSFMGASQSIATLPPVFNNSVDICNISDMSEFYTAYKDYRHNCTSTTNLSNATFFKYKP
jgi:hypothetical protein